MSTPFSARVTDPYWLREARAWIEQALPEPVAEVEQVRVRPWSTQQVVTTADGRRVWFKATCPSQAFEPGLQRLLAERAPDAVDAPLAADERGWMLTQDRGPTWGERTEPDLEQWCALVTLTASVQRRLADVDLGAVGVPDCSPATVAARFDRFVALLADLPAQHPSHVPPELRRRLVAVRPALVDAVEILETSGLPVTWQHGDLHPRNVLVADDGLRLFDLGDSQRAHALEVLCVPYGWICDRTDVPWEPVLEAYAHAWDVPADAVAAAWPAARLTQAVNRTLTWWSCLADATAQEWAEWGEAPAYHLARVLDA